MKKICLIIVAFFLSLLPNKQNTIINAPVSINSPSNTPTLIGIPKKHLIKTVFVPQAPEKNWDEPWQNACEEAALLTVDYYYQNKSPDIETIKSDLQNLIKTPNDIGVSEMSTYLTQYKPLIIGNPTIDGIKEYIAKDVPIIVPTNGKILYKENKFFNNQGPEYHNIVILGYDDNKQKFTVHDVGTQHGAYFKYSYKLLMESIMDKSSTTKQILILLK